MFGVHVLILCMLIRMTNDKLLCCCCRQQKSKVKKKLTAVSANEFPKFHFCSLKYELINSKEKVEGNWFEINMHASVFETLKNINAMSISKVRIRVLNASHKNYVNFSKFIESVPKQEIKFQLDKEQTKFKWS